MPKEPAAARPAREYGCCCCCYCSCGEQNYRRTEPHGQDHAACARSLHASGRATAAGAVTAIRNVTRTGTVGGTTPRIVNWNATAITVSHPCNAGYGGVGIYTANTAGAPVVTVTAAANYPSLFGALGFIDNSFQVRSSSQAVVNGI